MLKNPLLKEAQAKIEAGVQDRDAFSRIVQAGQKVMYDQATFAELAKGLKDAQDPVTEIAEGMIGILGILYKQSRKTMPIPPMVLAGMALLLDALDFAERAGLVKIGKADNYEKRINSISTACPYDIKLIGLVESEDCHSLERRFHRKYNAYRIRGEWFDIPESEKKLIAKKYNPDSLSGESSSPMTLFNIEEFTE